MPLPRMLTLSSTIALFASCPALADLTAEQVLNDQLRQMQVYGLTAKATSQSRNGTSVVVDGFSAGAVLPEGTLRVDFGGATFQEMGDGTVEIIYPETIPVRIFAMLEDEETIEIEMSLTHTDMRALVSGIPEEIRYDYTADEIALGDVTFLAPDSPDDLNMTVDLRATGLTSVSSFVGGGTIRDYDTNFTMATVSGTVDVSVPEEGPFNLAFEVQDMTGAYSGTVAPQSLMASFAQAVEAGNTSEGRGSHGPLTYTVAVDSDDGSFEMAAAVGSGEFDVKTGKDGIDYGGVSKDMTLSVGGSAIPLPPLTFKMAEAGGRMAMPIVPSEDSQDFAVLMNLKGLEIDQILWGMFDPTGQIPRDPANLVLDLSGKGKMTEDIFAPEFAETVTDAPGELEALTINQILLTLAGAELTADGAFTFDNAGPVPMPAGAITAMLTGGNGLLDTLVNMGLLPQEQAMGARMMMGLFARPGDGPDTLVSTIEVQEDGAVLANGQRIR